jgi:Ca-activated chloride channel family protein
MSFVYPWLMGIMLIPFVFFAFLVLTNKENVSRLFDTDVLKRLRVDHDALPVRVRNFVLLSSVALMILALGRPVIEHGERTVDLKGLDAMIALDISGSMRSKDVYPNRLAFAKQKIVQLLDAMPTDAVSLAAYAHAAFMLAPFTSDKSTLKQILEGVDESYINLSSTDFRALGELAATFLETKKPKILIVVTDGGDAQSLKGFQEQLRENNITLYAVLVGSKKGAPVLDTRGRPVHTAEGAIAITQRNDHLISVAKATGGEGVVAANGKQDMIRLADTLHGKFHAQNRGSIRIKDRTELFPYVLAGATILLLLGLISLPRKPLRLHRRSRT